ncbi:MFS transporter [Streptomyces sp. NPDC088400]|uniref:MFS transporter n=1 Tax=Streptomyces sp. NPDC088400 TaxID=3365861 RepID=UPI0038212DC7
MPHSPDAPSPLMTVTGHTLVLAQRHAPDKGSSRSTGSDADSGTTPGTDTPAGPNGRRTSPGRPTSPGSRTRAAPYRRLFAIPGTRAFTAGNLLARLPMGMFGVSAVIMIAGSRGSYALAGAVTATGLAATALVAPWTARLVDRYGQRRVAVPATAIAVLGSLALLLCVRYGAPDWALFVSYAATATTPNTGGMSRARWAHLHRERTPENAAALHTANSFEQAADELCFMLGPVLAALLCTTLFPEAGTLTGAILLLTGVLIFAAQRSTEPPATGRTDLARTPVLSPRWPRSSPSSSPRARSSARRRSSRSPSPTTAGIRRGRGRSSRSRPRGRARQGCSSVPCDLPDASLTGWCSASPR